MATLDSGLLEIALEEGLFKKPFPSKDRRRIYADQIQSIWLLLEILQNEKSALNVEQIQHRGLDFNENTLRIYLRWLRDKNFIEILPDPEDGKKNLYKSLNN